MSATRGGMALACLALGLSGCGGRSEHAGDEPAVPPVDQQPLATGACADSGSALRAELRWRRGGGMYGISDAPFFGFSPDGVQLMVPSDQYGMAGAPLLGVSDGSLLRSSEGVVLGRDAGWSLELRGSNPYPHLGEVQVVDLVREQLLFQLPDAPALVRASWDGAFVFGVYCQDVPRLERRRVADGVVTSIELLPELSPCGAEYGAGLTPFEVSRSNESVLFPAAQKNQLVVASFVTGKARAHTLHAPIDSTGMWPAIDEPLAFVLSPSEQELATVDGTGTLRLWSYPEMTPKLPAIALRVTRAFRDCYCTQHDFAPVAWSPDGRWLATSDELANAVVRRACDGAVIATIPALAEPGGVDESPSGPAFLAFSPDGRGLAVYRLDESFGGSIAYYELN